MSKIGFINVYKPSGVSSAFVVNRIKKKFNISKVGHMGTLDPLAQGILPIAVGKATRMFDCFLNNDKSYVAEFEFGYETDTFDIEGEVVNTTDNIPSKEAVIDFISKHIGKINQLPPNFSAKKINGKKAYELARSGVEFKLNPKEIEIYEFKLLEVISDKKYKFLIRCSSGTYIRSIARDIGRSLNSFATMTSLERVESGVFTLSSSIKLDDLLGLDEIQLIKIENVFNNISIINIDEMQFAKIKNGLSLAVNNDDGNYFIKYNDLLLGVAEVVNNQLKLKTYLLM